jgi:hypothetical protein
MKLFMPADPNPPLDQYAPTPEGNRTDPDQYARSPDDKLLRNLILTLVIFASVALALVLL